MEKKFTQFNKTVIKEKKELKQISIDKIKKKSFKRKTAVSLLKILSKNTKQIAKYGYQNTLIYKKLYGSLLSKYGKLDNIPFDELPVLTKEILSDCLPFDLLSDKLKGKVFKYGETTGSTGSPTPSFYTKKEFKGSVVLSKITPYHSLISELIKDNRKAVCGLACGFTIAGMSFQQILDSSGFLTINVDSRTTIAPPHRVARLLARFEPSLIAAGETDFLAWMKIVREEYSESYNDVVQNLKVVLSTAELCSVNRSKQIEKQFGITHIDNYACVEGYFSVPCPCGEKHILPVYKTEILSDDLTKTDEYGSGRFVFNNIVRLSTPFIRYCLDDYVTITKSECQYGFKKSITPHGRFELTVTINGKRYGTEHFESLLFKNYLFGEYNVKIYDKVIEIDAEDYESNPKKLKNALTIIKADFMEEFNKQVLINIFDYGTLRNYKEIRKSKPLFRLTDMRENSEQKIAKFV